MKMLNPLLFTKDFVMNCIKKVTKKGDLKTIVVLIICLILGALFIYLITRRLGRLKP